MTLPPQVRGYLITLEYGLIEYHVKRYGDRRFDLDQWTTARARRRGDRIRNLLQCKCPLMGWPGRAPALQDVRSCGGSRNTRSTSHFTQIRTTHRQHDRHRSR